MRGSIELNWLVSVVAVALGAFAGMSPVRAARIWGSERFDSLDPAERARFICWFRIFGILLLLAGLFFALDSIWQVNYER